MLTRYPAASLGNVDPASNPPRLLFVGLFNDVGSDRIVAAMGQLGAHCAVMSAANAFAAQTRFAERVFALPRCGGAWSRGMRLGRRLARAVRAFRPDLVIPLDEVSARSLRDPKLYRDAAPALRTLLAISLGRPDAFATLSNRHRLVDEARALGIATPTQLAVADLEAARLAAARLGYPVVLKREQTCGGAGVAILKCDDELALAFRRADAKARAKRRLQRLLGRDVTRDSPLALQRHVEGPLAFRIVACKDGGVLDGVSFLSEAVNPPVTGASTILTPIERQDMEAAAVALVAALGCSGIVSLDFILPSEGPSVFIEMNPRPIASGHLGRLVGHDIYASLLAALRDAPDRRPAKPAVTPNRIALFPRELDRDPSGSLARGDGILHDVPWDDPAAIRAHAAWLARRHPGEARQLLELLGVARPNGVDAPKLRRVVTTLLETLAHLHDLRGAASAK